MKKVRLLAYFALIAVAVASLLTVTVVHNHWPDWRWANEPFHSAIVVLGAIIFIFMAFVIFQGTQYHGGHLNFPAMGFLTMGIFEGVHAASPPGNTFVFLHTVGSLSGGLYFALAWVPSPSGVAPVRHGSCGRPSLVPCCVRYGHCCRPTPCRR